MTFGWPIVRLFSPLCLTTVTFHRYARTRLAEPWALPCRASEGFRDLLATALQALSSPSCALVEALSLASVANCIIKLVILPLWRIASDCQLTRSRKRAQWQSQGAQTRSRLAACALVRACPAPAPLHSLLVPFIATTFVLMFCRHTGSATITSGTHTGGVQ